MMVMATQTVNYALNKDVNLGNDGSLKLAILPNNKDGVTTC